jgi:hypothetical protein
MEDRLRLTPHLRRELERLCRGAGMVHLFGQTALPLTSRLYQSRWTQVWDFPTADSANAWNADWERWLEAGPAGSPDFLLAKGCASGLQAWVRIRAVEAIADEVRSGAPYPIALSGGRFELEVAHVYRTGGSRWRRDRLTLIAEGTPFGPFGDDPLWVLTARRAYPLGELPAATARILTRPNWRDLRRDYAPGEAAA